MLDCIGHMQTVGEKREKIAPIAYSWSGAGKETILFPTVQTFANLRTKVPSFGVSDHVKASPSASDGGRTRPRHFRPFYNGGGAPLSTLLSTASSFHAIYLRVPDTEADLAASSSWTAAAKGYK